MNIMCDGKYNPLKYLGDCFFFFFDRLGNSTAPAPYSGMQVPGSHQPRQQKMMDTNTAADMREGIEEPVGSGEDRVVR